MKENFYLETIEQIIKGFFDEVNDPEFDVYAFPQVWVSTALGYGGIGGSAMTKATTIILYSDRKDVAYVYPGSRELGYVVEVPSSDFWNDVYKRDILPVYLPEISKYGKKVIVRI